MWLEISSRNAYVSYLKMVDNSFLGSSDEVTRLLERVEATFIKHFTNANRSKEIKILRPKPKKERHKTTFSLGFFSGCAVALIQAIILIIRARHIIDQEGSIRYMETLFPLYRSKPSEVLSSISAIMVGETTNTYGTLAVVTAFTALSISS
ncbi:hypothetical protein GIB67_011895 [Kingdonia uniflora]|uniref:Uncharacterized protein n=1 Tax=Kingdonia uniflora TaxID=39325 RepID=A0A7J7LZZ5_9MAGN|nr:hypothetical protein GIB67_011895 [Kingdonia uniflora]